MRLEQIQRDFLHGGGALEWKPHIVRCAIVCVYKSKCKQGAMNLTKLNKALIGKLRYWFAYDIRLYGGKL